MGDPELGGGITNLVSSLGGHAEHLSPGDLNVLIQTCHSSGILEAKHSWKKPIVTFYYLCVGRKGKLYR